MQRQRDSAAIRTDAIEMALKKARNGCFSCMEGYFTLARQHGVNEEEIQAALEQATSTQGKGLQRRDLIKLLATGGVVVAAGGLALESHELIAGHAQPASPQWGVSSKRGKHRGHPQPIAAWWGTDSNSQACCAMPQNFYVGRMGYGAEPAGDAYFFNINAAKAAGHDHTYGYWGLVGPGYCPSNLSPFDWGRRQAACAWNSWNHGPSSAYIGGLTVFADVEPGFGGWSFGNYGPNQSVVEGFLQELFNITPPRVWPGLYISPYYWTNLVGRACRPSTDFVLWLTGCDTCGGDLCSPCNFACNTLITVGNRLAATVVNVVIGGRKPVAWQYWISGCQCGDYNVMTQYATSLTPANSNKTYAGC